MGLVSLVSCVREVRLLRRQTKASLEVPLLEKYPCSKFIIAIGNNAVGKWKCITLDILFKEQNLKLLTSFHQKRFRVSVTSFRKSYSRVTLYLSDISVPAHLVLSF